MPALQSWTAHADAGVRYFSGTATYRKTVDAPPAWFRPGARTLLDLGQVADLAQVLPDVLQDGDLLLMMGAGDIGYVAHQIAADGFVAGARA